MAAERGDVGGAQGHQDRVGHAMDEVQDGRQQKAHVSAQTDLWMKAGEGLSHWDMMLNYNCLFNSNEYHKIVLSVNQHVVFNTISSSWRHESCSYVPGVPLVSDCWGQSAEPGWRTEQEPRSLSACLPPPSNLKSQNTGLQACCYSQYVG